MEKIFHRGKKGIIIFFWLLEFKLYIHSLKFSLWKLKSKYNWLEILLLITEVFYIILS